MPNGKLVKGEIGRDNCFGSYNGTGGRLPSLLLVSCVVSRPASQPTRASFIFLRVQFSEAHFSFFFPIRSVRRTYSTLV